MTSAAIVVSEERRPLQILYSTVSLLSISKLAAMTGIYGTYILLVGIIFVFIGLVI